MKDNVLQEVVVITQGVSEYSPYEACSDREGHSQLTRCRVLPYAAYKIQ